ncbi:MAG: hypothetical protein WC373_11785 [Smithella sp.]|jgi:hypothetical protein
MDEIKLVALKNGQVIIGKAVFQVGEFGVNKEILTSIKEPRILFPNGDGRLQLGELYGQPSEIIITDEPVYYSEVKTKEIAAVYIQATSGLVI